MPMYQLEQALQSEGECEFFTDINSPLLSPTFTISRRCAERHIKWLRIPALCAVAEADAAIDAGASF